jgi:cobalt-zinc-cadmium efflux system protein
MAHGHHDEHHHHHGHGHSHAHAPVSGYGRAFVLAILLNSIFVSVEFVYGVLANSSALMADAGHNLSDVTGLFLAWGAAVLAKKAPFGRFTYGLRNASTLAALGNALLLLAACGVIAWQAFLRLAHPPEVAGFTVSVVATIGILINGFSAWLFMRGSKHDLNIRGAYLHMMADAAISLGVALAGLIMMWTHWTWVDPVVSLSIVGVILVGTWGLLRDSVQLALNAAPAHINLAGIETFLHQHPGVSDVHDVHVWGISTTECALTAHVVMPAGYPGDHVVDDMVTVLKTRFGVQHPTLQVETGATAHACCLQAQH